MGRARKDHLSRLFLNSMEKFTHRSRGAAREALRSKTRLSENAQGLSRWVNKPRVGRIEVFDSHNYAGGSFAGSFW